MLSKKNVFNTKLRYLKIMYIFFIWLIAVIAWNFGVPGAEPIEDVLVAIFLSFFSAGLKKYIK
jgi:hypothetical protein